MCQESCHCACTFRIREISVMDSCIATLLPSNNRRLRSWVLLFGAAVTKPSCIHAYMYYGPQRSWIIAHLYTRMDLKELTLNTVLY